MYPFGSSSPNILYVVGIVGIVGGVGVGKKNLFGVIGRTELLSSCEKFCGSGPPDQSGSSASLLTLIRGNVLSVVILASEWVDVKGSTREPTILLTDSMFYSKIIINNINKILKIRNK